MEVKEETATPEKRVQFDSTIAIKYYKEESPPE